MNRIRILLADDHTMIRAAFRCLLEPEFEVVGSVEDGRTLLLAAAKTHPDIVLLDIAMPLLNGIEAARHLKRTSPQLKLIFLTMNSDTDIAMEAFRVGASGYLLKNSEASELGNAIRQVAKGFRYVTPKIQQAMDAAFVRDPRSLDRPRRLTPRQVEVLQLLAEGQSLTGVATILQISHRTVRFHKSQIMEELEISTNAGLVQYAVRHSMISTA